MNQVLHSIHTSLHQYSYIPVMLFIVALLMVKASIHHQNERMRYVGYAVAVMLVICCVFIL